MASLGDQTTQNVRRPRRPRTRTLLGCLTCRLRHVKCSLERPSCRNCQRLSIECAGYGGKLKWLNYEGRDGKKVVLANGKEGDGERGAGRREIFSLAERRRMSQTMMKCLDDFGNEDTNQILSAALEKLDYETVSTDAHEECWQQESLGTQQVGPFGVFQARSSSMAPSNPTPSPSVLSQTATIGSRDSQNEEETTRRASIGISRSPRNATLFPSTTSPLSSRMSGSRVESEPDSVSVSAYSGGRVASVASIPSIAGTHATWEPDDPGGNGQLAAPHPRLESVTPSYSSAIGHAGDDVESISDAIVRIVQTTLSASPNPEPGSHIVPTLTIQQDSSSLAFPITLDDQTKREIRQCLRVFENNLSHLLSPLDLPGPNVRSRFCLDRALQCFGKLSVFLEATIDSQALLYSLLAMTAAHMEAVFEGIPGAEASRSDREHRHAVTSRYVDLSSKCLELVLQKEALSKMEYKNILTTFLNITLTVAKSDFFRPISDLVHRIIHFIARSSPRIAATHRKSKTILSLEYLLLQDCVLNSALHSPSLPLIVEDLHLLRSLDLWKSFLAVSENGFREHGDSPRETSERGNRISGRDLRQLVGSPVPPSLLMLILEHALLLKKTAAGMQVQEEEISSLEKRICAWTANFDDSTDGTSYQIEFEDFGSDDMSETEDYNYSDFEGEEEPTGPRSAASSHEVVASLTGAFHTALLVDFFSCTKPTNKYLLQPYLRQLLHLLKLYVRAVKDADIDVGIGTGLVWPLRILDRAALNKWERTQVNRLWEYVEGAGLRVEK